LISGVIAPGYKNGSPRIAALHGLDEITVDDRLEYITGGAGLERLIQVLLVLMHRQDQGP
jgi:hypothetical protein